MLSEELVDIATRHQVYLERFKAGLLKATDQLFVQLNRDLVALLNRFGVERMGVLTAVQRRRLLDALRDGQAGAYQERIDSLLSEFVALAQFEQEFELESINEVLVPEIEAVTEDDAAPVWAFVQEQPMGSTGALLSVWLVGWAANEVRRSTDLMRRAAAEDWTRAQVIRAYRGTNEGRFVDGLFGSARRNTSATINTAVQHVSASARARTMDKTIFKLRGAGRIKVTAEGTVSSITSRAAKRAGIKVGDNVKLMGYRWISILDNKTSQICRSLDQQVFKFGKGPLPPAHVNCRSSITAEIAGRYLRRDASGRFTRRDERTATGAGGVEPVDGGATYYEWLKTQPAAFQDDALGVTRAELFRKGGMSAATFAKLNLGRNFKPLTLDEMRKLKPNAFRRAGL